MAVMQGMDCIHKCDRSMSMDSYKDVVENTLENLRVYFLEYLRTLQQYNIMYVQ